MTRIAMAIGRKTTYSLALVLGGVGYISMYFLNTPGMLIFSMVGIGIAWAAILAMPYSLLSESLPADKMGVYMGIFNFTIAGPQIISGLLSGAILSHFFKNNAIYMLVICGVSMFFGAFSVLTIKTKKTEAYN